MDTVDANFAGLGSLSATCRDLAADLTAPVPPAPPTASFQPSAAAVASGHADTSAVEGRFAARLHDTATALDTTAAMLRGTDEANAARIAAVAE